ILVYGIFMFISKTKMHLPGEKRLISQNYLKTFLNGFLLNLLNIGVLLFWLVTVITARKHYPEIPEFVLYISIFILTYFFIDLIIIYMYKLFLDILSYKVANSIRKAVRVIHVILIIFILL